jgi:hypothetical protein
MGGVEVDVDEADEPAAVRVVYVDVVDVKVDFLVVYQDAEEPRCFIESDLSAFRGVDVGESYPVP